MRYLFFLISFFISFILQGQSLTSATWIKIKAERKDGSKIIDRLNSDSSKLEYHFLQNDTVLISDMMGSKQKYAYRIEKNKLSIGKYQNFAIETFTDSSLILLELPGMELNDDKVNRFYFISNDKYFNFLSSNGLINSINDSLILSNRYVSAQFEGNFDKYLLANISNIFDRTYLIGSFVVSSSGNITEFVIIESKGVSDKYIDKFTTLFLNTSGKWTLPIWNKPYYCKTYFNIRFNADKNFSGISFHINTNKPPCFDKCALSMSDIKLSTEYFNSGTQLLLKGNYEKAIIKFSDCLKIDSLYVDAYYNRATANYKLANQNAACLDWKTLRQLGQKEGEKLYSENCKE